MSLSASLSAWAAPHLTRQPLPPRSSSSPSPSVRASLALALPLSFNTAFLALSPPSPFNVLFKCSQAHGHTDRRTDGRTGRDREVGNGSRQWGGTEEEMNNMKDDGAASGGAGKVHSHKTILLAAPRSGGGEKR